MRTSGSARLQALPPVPSSCCVTRSTRHAHVLALSFFAALSKVIMALQSKASHVPYRDSVLTYMLQNSLGGCVRAAWW